MRAVSDEKEMFLNDGSYRFHPSDWMILGDLVIIARLGYSGRPELEVQYVDDFLDIRIQR